MFGDTIAAIATPIGEGALSIVRISGPTAVRVADECFRGGKNPSEMPSHTVSYGRVVDKRGDTIDRVLLTVMRGPGTSTGEDTVEISCHGGRVPSALVLEQVLAAGARLAEAGEFTRRGFLNGRMDLVQAEGVVEIIQARTDAGLRAAVRQAGGEVSRELRSLRGELDECRVHLECEIDFAEDTAPWSDEEMGKKLADVARRLEAMLDRCRLGRRLQDGTDVAIVGKPNVGKSTLFNCLVGEDRVIVSDKPGTTRDVVAEWISMGGVPTRLLDTAGIRSGTSGIEEIAVERARREGKRAEIVLHLLDAAGVPDDEDRKALTGCSGDQVLLVLNKIDFGVRREVENLVSGLGPGVPVVRVSALRGDGVDDLKQELGRRIAGNLEPEVGVPASVRQIDILRRTYDMVIKSVDAINSGGIEIAAVDLREAVEAFGDLSGETTSEEILERIFSRFCIGK
ncbi:MAG: tRNA uridine-5-carboxymethylaminomethyl(34) synthesis GTPase MnmE [Candidatus Eisenbacteria sp.]|nr:tRNA uridine-5-carboxymethylaminomethyl(34) synthesis GTPase MnmE [Candidatus Eisenbacteria bacterium]